MHRNACEGFDKIGRGLLTSHGQRVPCGYGVTVKLVVVEWVKVLYFPVIFKVKVPVVPVADGVTVRVEVLGVGLGENLLAAPEGLPVRVSDTEFVKPFRGVMVTV